MQPRATIARTKPPSSVPVLFVVFHWWGPSGPHRCFWGASTTVAVLRTVPRQVFGFGAGGLGGQGQWPAFEGFEVLAHGRIGEVVAERRGIAETWLERRCWNRSNSIFGKQLLNYYSMGWFRKKKKCQRFYELASQTVDLAGLQVGLPKEYNLALGSLKIEKQFNTVSEQLQQLDQIQYGLCMDIMNLSDQAKRDELLAQVIETKRRMLELVITVFNPTAPKPGPGPADPPAAAAEKKGPFIPMFKFVLGKAANGRPEIGLEPGSNFESALRLAKERRTSKLQPNFEVQVEQPAQTHSDTAEQETARLQHARLEMEVRQRAVICIDLLENNYVHFGAGEVQRCVLACLNKYRNTDGVVPNGWTKIQAWEEKHFKVNFGMWLPPERLEMFREWKKESTIEDLKLSLQGRIFDAHDLPDPILIYDFLPAMSYELYRLMYLAGQTIPYDELLHRGLYKIGLG